MKATKGALAQGDLQQVSNGLQLLLFISRRDAQGSTTIAKHGGPAMLLGKPLQPPATTRIAGPCHVSSWDLRGA